MQEHAEKDSSGICHACVADLCAGRYTDTPGLPVCFPCRPGYFAPTTGTQYCSPCPVGSTIDWRTDIPFQQWSATYQQSCNQ